MEVKKSNRVQYERRGVTRWIVDTHKEKGLGLTNKREYGADSAKNAFKHRHKHWRLRKFFVNDLTVARLVLKTRRLPMLWSTGQIASPIKWATTHQSKPTSIVRSPVQEITF